MGGRGGNSGITKERGFSFIMNGKTTMVQRTSTGTVLVNGQYKEGANYDKLQKSARTKDGYKEYNSGQIAKMRTERATRKKVDYEMGVGLENNSANRRAARRSRLIDRAARRKG